MSQSDYIQFIRTADVLKNQTKLSPVLTSNEYTDYESYALETTIPNTKNSFSRLLPPTQSRTIFDMEKKSLSLSYFSIMLQYKSKTQSTTPS